MLLINFKSYKEATGKKAVKLAKICQQVSNKYKVRIFVCPQYLDILQVKKFVPVLAQHVDSVDSGQYTGRVSVWSVKQVGAKGTLLNHSERKLKLEEIEKSVKLIKKYKLLAVCCSKNVAESKKLARLNPDFIAYEPPELIGTGKSVSTAKPKIIGKTVEAVKEINPRVKVLCGAGVTTGEDVVRTLQLGTKGVLVASAVVKAKNPRNKLRELAKAVKSKENLR